MWLSLSLLVPVALTAAQPGASSRPAADVLATLRPGHPRLIILDADLARVRRLIESDAEVRQLRDRLRSAADDMLDDPPVVHRLIGPRLLHQSRLCLDRVYTLATLYRLEGDPRYAQRAEKELLAAAAFPDWNPSHFLDTAEMSHAFGIGYDWLFDYLSPASRRAIREALVEKGLRPSAELHRRRSSRVRGTNNWNQVCNGGMTIGALAVADEEPDLARFIIEQAADGIRIPTTRLYPNGGWDEGPGYWGYAMSYTACYLAAMRSALGTDLGLSQTPGLDVTGLFRIHFVGPTGHTFNYADAGSAAGNAPQMFYFAQIFDRPVYAWHERRMRARNSALDLLWYDPRGTRADLLALPRDAWFRNVDVVFLRSAWDDPDAWFVGFKGGDNQASHSHLDLGSFVLDALGCRWATDIGPDDYNLPGYFGNKRWTYYRLRTEGQNTIVIDGANQSPRGKAPIIAFDSKPSRAAAVADLTQAYAEQAGRVRRGVALLDRNRVLIQDEIDTNRPITVDWGLHTPADVRIEGPLVTLRQKDRTLCLRNLEAKGGSWSCGPVPIDPPQKPAEGVRKLILRLRVEPPGARIAVLFAGSPDASAPIIPLDDWVR